MARTSSAVLEDGAKGGAAAPANATARRKQIQSVVLLLFALGALSVVVRVADLSVYSSATTSTSASRAAGLAQMRSASRVATPLKAKSNASVVTEESPKMKAARLEQLAAMVEAVGVQRPAHQYDSKTREMCFRERDVGMLEAIRGSAKEFCGQASAADGALPKRSPSAATAVTLYRVRGGIKSAVLENVMVDLTDAEIFHPIKSMAEDGGSHDPRFKFNPRLVNCACKELADHYLAMSEPQRAHDHLWTPSVADIPDSEATPMSLLCAPKPESVFTDGSDVSTWDFVRHPDAPPNASAAVVFEDPVIMIARRDDHNPFFQISYALNAWVMVQALGWDLARTRVLHFDAGYPSPIDALHQKLFSDDRPLMEAHQMMGKQLHFKNQVLVAPFELSGPMMQHLDDEEPCYDSEMLKKFRELSLTSQGITPTVVADLAVTKVRPFTVTIITRKPYDGRKLQRVWLNEDEVVGKMRAEYSGLNVEFRSIDYVLLSLEEQMRTTLESDLVIGMHGAGMVNVMWARPEAVIVEIFPKERFRWGYRNLCQFLGCHWHEFRGGEDLGDNPTPNTKDKNIPYDEWMAFFHPLFRDAYSVFDEKQRVLQHQLEGI